MKETEVITMDSPLYCNECGDEINFCDECGENFWEMDDIYCDRDDRGHLCKECGEN